MLVTIIRRYDVIAGEVDCMGARDFEVSILTFWDCNVKILLVMLGWRR